MADPSATTATQSSESRFSQTIWGKGFEWAFSEGLILTINPRDARMQMTPSTSPPADALELQKRLAGITVGTNGLVFVLSQKKLGISFPCRDTEVLIRDAYYTAFRLCMQHVDQSRERWRIPGVLLRGSLGIGKSYFITFCLIMRLLQGHPTAFQDCSGNILRLFTETGCQNMIRDKHEESDLDEDPTVIALCDSVPDVRLLSSHTGREWPIVCAAPALGSLYSPVLCSRDMPEFRSFRKTCWPEEIYMDVPTRFELTIMHSVLRIWGSHLTAPEFQTFVTHFNPSLHILAKASSGSGGDWSRNFDFVHSRYIVNLIAKAKCILRGKKDPIDLGVFDDQPYEREETIVVLRPLEKSGGYCSVSRSGGDAVPTRMLWLVLARAAEEVRWEKGYIRNWLYVSKDFMEECWAEYWKGVLGSTKEACEFWGPRLAPNFKRDAPRTDLHSDVWKEAVEFSRPKPFGTSFKSARAERFPVKEAVKKDDTAWFKGTEEELEEIVTAMMKRARALEGETRDEFREEMKGEMERELQKEMEKEETVKIARLEAERETKAMQEEKVELEGELDRYLKELPKGENMKRKQADTEDGELHDAKIIAKHPKTVL
ncbi:hypothetical protein BJ508DRAFT_314884 [Ascobolus immersus RN42]|uniref:Uncharacterized protein n=1 Tax=Ascobolus immersus RN42 TaxID=1160509 RepID=A0A3N4HGR1_ASCIM|nr:hypothetical protein BJ508DRAFT_314884 [Ascobolus immersus RN42]